MKALGYILIVLVLITAGCFIYFATGVLVERQKWSSAVFRHELAIQGLPVEPPSAEQAQKYADDPERLPFSYRFEGGTGEIEWISTDQLTDVFRAIDANKAKSPVDGGSVLKGDAPQGQAVLVTNQVDEVERVRGILSDLIRQETPERRVRLIGALLLSLANTNPERDYVLDLYTKLADGSLTSEEVTGAERKLDGYFEYALARTAEEVKQAVRKIEGLDDNQDLSEVIWVQSAIQVENDRRQEVGSEPMETSEQAAFVERLFPQPGEIDKRARIADVLFNAGRAVNRAEDEIHWQLRVITVVGLEQYVKTVTRKANVLSEIAARLRVQINQEEADFRGQYPRLVETSRTLAGQLAELQRQVVRDEAEKTANEELRDQRNREVLALDNELSEKTQLAEQSLREQADLEKQLFGTQIQLGAALEAIVRLETELRELELGDGR